MRLPSRLLCSRHGIWYLRVIIPQELRSQFDGRREFRYSLLTKHRQDAFSLARIINAKVDSALMALKGEAMAGIRKVRLDDVLDITGDLKQYKLKLPSGVEIEANGEEDHKRAMEALSASIAPRYDYVESRPEYPSSAGATSTAMLLDQAIADSESLEGSVLSGKTSYEYKRMQEKFAEWFATNKKRPNPPMHNITKADISDYVKHLKTVENLTPYTIDAKYLPAITKLFQRARKSGAFPEQGDFPTHGQRLMTTLQRTKKREKQKLDKPYTTAELQVIFAPENLNAVKKPHEFWLPLLALFTGARLNELCQMLLADIIHKDGIWMFDINNKGEKSVKTTSAVRKIPMSQTLIDIGLLEYLSDVQALKGATMLFPYLHRDKTGQHYTHDATRDWRAYRKKLGMAMGSLEARNDYDGGFHPLRYNAINFWKDAKLPDQMRLEVAGHAVEGVSSRVYEKKFSVEATAPAIATLSYPEINFSGLRYENLRERFKTYLAQAYARRRSYDAHVEASKARGAPAEVSKKKKAGNKK